MSKAATIVSRVFEPEGTAAAYRLGSLARSLEQHGFTTTVLTTRSPGAPKSTLRIRRAPVFRDRSGAVRGYLQYLSFDVPAFFRLLFAPRADVVIAEPPPTTGFVTRLACAIRRTPYVYFSADVTSAALRSIRVNRLVARTVRTMERWVLGGASAVLAVSEGVRQELLQLGVPTEKIAVVGTGIDTDRFSPDGDLPHTDWPYLVYAGTMSEFQGAEVFVEAFELVHESHPEARLVFIGGGVDLDHIKDRAAPLGDRVVFCPFIPSEDAARWLRGAVASLASVRPGRGYDFAFPTKALASASCGTPVIFAGAGPLRELVAERRLGWSVPWEPGAVAEAMVRALDRGHQPLGTDSTVWVADEFSLAAVADRATRFIAAALGSQTSR